jgi:hypothetical protein
MSPVCDVSSSLGSLHNIFDIKLARVDKLLNLVFDLRVEILGLIQGERLQILKESFDIVHNQNSFLPGSFIVFI